MKLIFSTGLLSLSTEEGLLFSTFFADDLTLFSTADKVNCHTISKTLQSFSLHSGKKVNLSKSKVIFSKIVAFLLSKISPPYFV